MNRNRALVAAVAAAAGVLLTACGSTSATSQTTAATATAPAPASSPASTGAPTSSTSPAPSTTPTSTPTPDPTVGGPVTAINGASIDAQTINPELAALFDSYGGADAIKYGVKWLLAQAATTWTDQTFFNIDTYTPARAAAIAKPGFTSGAWKPLADYMQFEAENRAAIAKINAHGGYDNAAPGDRAAEKKLVEDYNNAVDTLRSIFLFGYSDNSHPDEWVPTSTGNVVHGFGWGPIKLGTYPSPNGKKDYLGVKVVTYTYLQENTGQVWRFNRDFTFLLDPTVGPATADNPTGTTWKVASWLGLNHGAKKVDSIPSTQPGAGSE